MKRVNAYTADYTKTAEEIRGIEKASRVVAETLSLVEKSIHAGMTTLEIDKIAEDYILSKNAIPATKGYREGRLVFPATLCISVNEEIVHGIPSERVIKDGDIVSCDCVAELNGFFGDSAITVPVGKIDEKKARLIKATEEALFCGIEQAVTGNKLYDIAAAVQARVEADGFNCTRELVGHGIGRSMHEEPPVPNFVPPLLYRKIFPNVKLVKTMAICIEPMVQAGRKETRELSNGWTFVTADGEPAAHIEHTIIVDDGKAHILTLRD